MTEDQKCRAKETHGNGLRHPSQSCLAGHDRCPRSMLLPSQSSAGRAHGRSRRALKLQDGPGHMEVVAPNECSGGTGLATGTAPWGLGMGLHPSLSGCNPGAPSTAASGARSRSGSCGTFTWGGRGGAAPAGAAYTGIRGCHHAPLAPRGCPITLTSSAAPSPGRGWLSLPTGINSLRCYIKCFNKSLIYHTSCLFSINSFSNFTQKRQSSRTGQIYSV